MAFLCYTNKYKGKSDCFHTLLQVYENMGGNENIANEKLHVQLFFDDMNSTQMEEMLGKAGEKARGKQAGPTSARPHSSYKPPMSTQQQ